MINYDIQKNKHSRPCNIHSTVWNFFTLEITLPIVNVQLHVTLPVSVSWL